MEVENPFSWFTDDPLILLITTIGLLIMTGLAMFEGIKLFRDHHNRPRIKLVLQKIVEKDKEGKKLSFWVFVHNVGRGFLSQCKVRVRITNHSGNIDLIDKTGKKYKEEFIPLLWKDENKSFPSIDLYPAETEYGKFKIPLDVRLPDHDPNLPFFVNEPLFSVKFIDPAKVSWVQNPTSQLKGIGSALTFYVVFSVYINSMENSFKKNIRVVIPVNVETLKEDYILFEEKKISTFFTDGLFALISMFKRAHD